MTCPRCAGQKYNRGWCALCGNLGWLCPECAGRMARTPIYSGGRNVYRCTECKAFVVNEAQELVSASKLVPLAREHEAEHRGNVR